MAEVAILDVTKEFPGGAVAVNHLSITADDGEFLILVGPSGCGKTTALRMVAGLDEPTSGMIAIGDRIVTGLSPKDRDIAMVFQNYALYPHMTVYRNLAFGLKQRKEPKEEIGRRVKEVAAMLGIEELLGRKPAQLSGGQRQRVAMGRALVREPTAFLLDEPLSNLDAKLRIQVRADLKRLHRRLGITTIYVTHDQVEAMTLGDRIVVMSGGELQQVGTPQDVYDRPANIFVAGFIGSPPMNLLRGSAVGGRITAGDLTFELGGVRDGEVALGVRPEHFAPATDGLPTIDLHVDVVEPLGDEVIVYGSVAGEVASAEMRVGEELLPPLPGSRAEITVRLGPHERPRMGESLTLGVRPDVVHIFDAHTGAAIH